MDARLRPMSIADFHAAASLWAVAEGIGLNEPDTLEAIGAYLERNPGLSLVAEVDGAIVAAVLCGHDGRRGYLHHLAVATGCRGQGLGRRLVACCLESLRAV